MELLKIDSVMFRVSNLEEAAKFYREVLGLKKAWRDSQNAMMGFIFPESDSEIVIHSNSDIPTPAFSFLVKDVENFCRDYRKTGNKILTEPFEVRTGKLAIVSDPDGNAIPIIDLSKFGGHPRYD